MRGEAKPLTMKGKQLPVKKADVVFQPFTVHFVGIQERVHVFPQTFILKVEVGLTVDARLQFYLQRVYLLAERPHVIAGWRELRKLPGWRRTLHVGEWRKMEQRL
jgi:hypothetical protein